VARIWKIRAKGKVREPNQKKGKRNGRACGECGVPIRVMGHISGICPAVWVQLNRPLETGRKP